MIRVGVKVWEKVLMQSDFSGLIKGVTIQDALLGFQAKLLYVLCAYKEFETVLPKFTLPPEIVRFLLEKTLCQCATHIWA